VIARAQELGLAGIAVRMSQLALEARTGKLRPDDLQGGTYTISNSGTFGTLITAPIINQPQVAILSTDGIRKRPVVIESAAGDAIAIRPVGVLAQSFDHRAIDGAYSAAFLRSLKRTLESSDWISLLGDTRKG
jgi:pyruvate dehydrogenase E2 component (dihydrolipoamide acetyltransferase)